MIQRRSVQSIGLTGGIGSGKSTVAGLLVMRGAHRVDTDAIARELTQAGGAAMAGLVQEFGAQIRAADGSLRRDAMRQLAFTDASAKARLEAILHPLIGVEALRRSLDAQGRTVVFDVPLLAEASHWRARVDRVLVVDCGEAEQARRVAQRPGWTLESARQVMAQQAPRSRRRALADAVIYNDGISLEQLEAQVQRLWVLWSSPSG